MGNTPTKRGSPLRTSSQASAGQRLAGSKTSSMPLSELSSEPSSSEPSSSEASNSAFRRLGRGLVLPSASSQVNIQYLTKKLTAGSLARRNTPTAAHQHVDKTVPRRARPAFSTEDGVVPQVSPRLLSADHQLNQDATVHRTSRNTVDDWDYTLESRTLASQLPSQSDRRAVPHALNGKRQNVKSSGGIYVERANADEESEDSVPDLEPSDLRRITEQWTRVKERRDAMHETFRRVGKQRTKLLDIRRDRNGAYQKLKLEIQRVLPDNADLVKLFQQVDHLELTYQSAEITVDDLIDEVHEGEFQLELEERRFFTNLVGSNTSSGSLSRASSRDTLRGIEGDRTADKHPLLEALQTSHQEVKLAQETLDDLDKRRQILLLKGAHKWTSEEAEFMEDLNDLESQTQEAFHHWSASAIRLQKECREQNLIPEDENAQNELFGLQDPSDEIYLDEPMYPGNVPRSDLTHPRFGILLTNPRHLLRNPPETAQTFLRTALSLPKSLPRRQYFIEEAKKEFGIESLLQASESEDKIRYINRWLLHRLRLSPMEAELLLVQFVAVLKLQDPENWQHDVLFYWSRDSAAMEVANDASSTDAHDKSSDSSLNSNKIYKQSASSSRKPGRTSTHLQGTSGQSSQSNMIGEALSNSGNDL